jgi:hypothetical protein
MMIVGTEKELSKTDYLRPPEKKFVVLGTQKK